MSDRFVPYCPLCRDFESRDHATRCQLGRLKAEVAALRCAESFHKVAVKERDYERTKNETLRLEVEALRAALQLAKAALEDIGDADREPGDDVAWCERRAAQPLPIVRTALAAKYTRKDGA